MRFIDLDSMHEVFSTLSRNKLRLLMTASGVFWGIFMLLVMLGFGNGLEAGVSKNMIGFVSNSVYTWGQRTSKPHEGFQPGRRVRLRNEDAAALEAGLDDVAVVAPRAQLGGWRDGNNVTYQEKTGNFSVMGDTPAITQIVPIFPYEGRFLNQLDMDQRRKVAVIGEQVRTVLFGRQSPLGESIKVRGIHFEVIGVFKSEQPADQGERANATVFVPLSTFQTSLAPNREVNWFALLARPGASSEALEQQALAILKRQHSVAPDDTNAFGSYNAAKQVERVSNMFTGIRFFVWFVGILTLLAGALGVSNIMLISVRERTVEFGVRKALGATPASIVALVMQEAALLTSLAGYSGLVCAVLTMEGLRHFVPDGEGPLASPRIDLAVGLVATLVLLVVGVIAGVAPARRAASIRPVEALRSE